MEDCYRFSFNDTIVRELIKRNEYHENVKFKSNCLWVLQITNSPLIMKTSDVFDSSYEPDFYCRFILCRHYGTKPETLTVWFFDNSACFFEKEVFFDTKTIFMELEFGKITIARLQASKIDIVFCFKQNAKQQKSLQDVTLKKPEDLREDFMCLLRGGDMTDVELKCASETVNAHKLVLSARSPVFKAMFSNEMQESRTNSLTVDDMDTSSFRAWIDFVYGGEVNVTSVSLAYDLLDAAEKYQMKGLKEVCIEHLESVLSPENAVHLLETANLYDEQFKSKVISYISEHLSDLKTSKDWKDLKSRKPALALDVYSYNEQKSIGFNIE